MRRRIRRSGLALQLDEILIFEIDFAVGRTVKLENAAPRSRFAAATLTHQTQGLTFVDVEGDVVDRLDVADVALDDDPLRDREIHLEVLNPEQGFFFGHVWSHFSTVPTLIYSRDS